MSGFDPYREWLGIERHSPRLNHYELLGLPLFASEPPVIAEAVDAQIARVEARRSPEHQAQVEQLLGELAQARRQLLSPQLRREYEQQLRVELGLAQAAPPTAQAPPHSAPMPQAPQVSPPPAMVAAPPVITPPPVIVPPPAAGAGYPPAQGYGYPPAYPYATGPAYMPAQGYLPVEGYPPGIGYPPAQGYPPAESSAPPMATPQAAQHQTVPPQVTQPQAMSSSVAQRGAATSQTARPGQKAPAAHSPATSAAAIHASTASSSGWRLRVQSPGGVALVAASVAILGGALIFAFSGSRADRDSLVADASFEAPENNAATEPTTEPGMPGSTMPVEPPAATGTPDPEAERKLREQFGLEMPAQTAQLPATPSQPAPRRPANRPRPMAPAATGPEPAMPVEPSMPNEPAMPATDMPGPESSMPAESMPAESMPSESSDSPSASMTPGTPSDPAATMPTGPASADPADKAKIERSLKLVQTALASRELAQARTQLDLAGLEAESLETLTAVENMTQLTDTVEKFWQAVAAGAGVLQPLDKFEADGETITVINNENEKLTLQFPDRRREFALDKLPANVARALAEKALGADSSEAKLAVGAFLMVEPRADRAQARTLLEQAQSAGVEVQTLLNMLDGT